MKLLTLVIHSFSRSCQADMDDIKRFLARHHPDDLIAGSGLLAKKLETADDLVAMMVPYGCSGV